MESVLEGFYQLDLMTRLDVAAGLGVYALVFVLLIFNIFRKFEFNLDDLTFWFLIAVTAIVGDSFHRQALKQQVFKQSCYEAGEDFNTGGIYGRYN